jgi:copper(I)-binding protein
MLAPMHTRILFIALALASVQSVAQVKVEGAWARPTVAGQQGGGGFMALVAAKDDKLVGGSTPVAQRFELHTMAMKGDVMEMREVSKVDLPAGQKVEFKPGGLHVMFIGLKAPLKVGDKVPVTLKFEKTGEVKVDFEIMARPKAAEHKH